jgi:hypothetical protein
LAVQFQVQQNDLRFSNGIDVAADMTHVIVTQFQQLDSTLSRLHIIGAINGMRARLRLSPEGRQADQVRN